MFNIKSLLLDYVVRWFACLISEVLHALCRVTNPAGQGRVFSAIAHVLVLGSRPSLCAYLLGFVLFEGAGYMESSLGIQNNNIAMYTKCH